MKRALAAAAVLALAACNRAPSATPATPTATAGVSSPVASASAAATPIAAPAGLPPYTFEGFPGWLGYATNESGTREDSPKHTTAEVALAENPLWTKEHPVLRASAPGAAEVVTFAVQEETPYGCDGRTATFAFFDAPKRFQPGPVWLAPLGTGVVVKEVAEVPKKDVPDFIQKGGSDFRVWLAGSDYFVARRTPKSFIWQVLIAEGAELFREEFPYTAMEGADDETPSLEGGPGVPIPRLIVEAGNQKLLLIQSDGFEGAGFVGLFLRPKMKRAEGRPYLYWCAF